MLTSHPTSFRRVPLGLFVAASLLVTSCQHAARDAFTERLATVTVAPGPLDEDWQPDASIYLSPAAVQTAVKAGIDQAQATAELSVPGLRAVPHFEVASMVLDLPSVRCPGCLGVQGRLDGVLHVDVLGMKTSANITANLTLDVRLDAEQRDGTWVITVHPQRVRKVGVHFGRSPGGVASYLDLSPVGDWLRDALLQVPPIPVVRLGDSELPIRGLRMNVDRTGVRVALRTQATSPGEATPPPTPDTGWTAQIRTDSVLALARRALFAQGALDHGIWPDPTALSIAPDGTFQLGLRLWRPKASWWRDYSVRGTTQLRRGELALIADEVLLVDASKGAKLADPIAAMAKGAILKAIGEAVSTSVPARFDASVGQDALRWVVTGVQGEGQELAVTGTMRRHQPSK